jgi:hypothetical protein
MKRVTGAIVLGLSACGYPLTQLVVRRWDVRGAAMAECACAGLAIRDASMVAGGVPGRLRRVPAALLFLELGAGVMASLAGLPPLLSAQPTDRTASARTCAADRVRRAAVAVLFAIHTVRFAMRFSQRVSADHLVLELREDKRGFGDVADRGRAKADVLDGAPAL